MSLLAAALALFLAVTLGVSVAVVRRLHRPERRWRDTASDRLVMGVPWGTLVVVGFVLAIYLFVQDGISNFGDPVTIPYRSWSYFYPLGIGTASFAHASPGHLISNLAGAVVAAPIAEYAWGHYVDRDGNEDASPDTTASRLDPDAWRTDPWIRALVIFPLAVIGVGLLTSIFALGPVIGFSGVVFAFVGFAIVHYPIATLVAAIGVQSALTTIYSALRMPIYTYTASPSPPSAPSWAEIAIQGHALGFFIGLVLALALLHRRGDRPNALHLWVAVVIYALSRGLWQIYWFGPGETYILFQGPGIAIVALLALVITIAVTASDRPIVPERFERYVPGVRTTESDEDASGSSVDRPLAIANGGSDGERGGRGERSERGDRETAEARFDRIRDIASGARTRQSALASRFTRRSSAVTVVFVVLAVLAGMAIPVNLVFFGETTAADNAVEIEDYTIEYTADAQNQLVSGVGLDAVLGETGLEASGVVVSSTERNIWMEVVTEHHLAHTGGETVSVGGPGWREAVHVERVGWEPVGNDAVYQIWLWQDGDDRELAYESDEMMADVILDERVIVLTTADGEFVLEVATNETEPIDSTPVPDEDETAEAGGIVFERDGGTIYAVSNGTAVAIASEETYD